MLWVTTGLTKLILSMNVRVCVVGLVVTTTGILVVKLVKGVNVKVALAV